MNNIEYNLRECLKYNTQEDFSVDDIKEVLAVWEGAPDGDCWRWVFQLNDERFVFMMGWCCFTGWDCQSNTDSCFADNAINAANMSLDDYCHDNEKEARISLLSQLEHGKITTWREKMDKEFELEHKRIGEDTK